MTRGLQPDRRLRTFLNNMDNDHIRGFVVRGSRNIFTVRVEGVKNEIECRIKGKVLKGVEGYYNPLSPGDIVEIEGSQIVGVEKKRNGRR